MTTLFYFRFISATAPKWFPSQRHSVSESHTDLYMATGNNIRRFIGDGSLKHWRSFLPGPSLKYPDMLIENVVHEEPGPLPLWSGTGTTVLQQRNVTRTYYSAKRGGVEQYWTEGPGVYCIGVDNPDHIKDMVRKVKTWKDSPVVVEDIQA
jgi:hypothetical protein